MYLPAFYYPIKKNDRATGFLMPDLRIVHARGQSLTNQFFWAISRSQDATIEHDWFSKTGQQVGGEYRYVAGPGSQGNADAVLLTSTRPTRHAATGRYLTRCLPGRAIAWTAAICAAAAGQPACARQHQLLHQHRDEPAVSAGHPPITNRSRSFGGNLSGAGRNTRRA